MFPQKFDVQTSHKPLNLTLVVNIKFPQATYHTMVASTKELYCLHSQSRLLNFHFLIGSPRTGYQRITLLFAL